MTPADVFFFILAGAATIFVAASLVMLLYFGLEKLWKKLR